MSNRVIHFEIPCENPDKTMEFFKNVFDWKFQQFGEMEYWSVITGDEKSPGINGGLMKRNDPMQPVANSIQVNNIDEMIAKINNSGGEVVVPKTIIPTIGWMAYFKDPDGNIHGLFQDDPSVKEN